MGGDAEGTRGGGGSGGLIGSCDNSGNSFQGAGEKIYGL